MAAQQYLVGGEVLCRASGIDDRGDGTQLSLGGDLETRVGATSSAAQDLAARHVQWLSGVPGTPAVAGGQQLSPCCGWRGEVWPKFTVVLTGDIDAAMVTSETLGAACAVSIKPE